MTLGAFEPDRVNDLLAEMSEAARKLLGGAASDLTETRAAYMRYRGQGHEITVPAPTDELNAGTAQALAAGFDARYTLLFGQTIPDLEVEILTWTVRVERKGHQAGGGRNARSASEIQGSLHTISVFDAAQSRRLDYAVLPRETLSAGFGISGPCLVTESHTTTVVSSDFDLEVAADGALLLTSKPAMEGISQ